MLIALSAPLNNVGSVSETAQSILQSGGRILLMIAMVLFLAYMLFMLCAVTLSSAYTTWHTLRQHSRRASTAAITGGSHALHAGRHVRDTRATIGSDKHSSQR